MVPYEIMIFESSLASIEFEVWRNSLTSNQFVVWEQHIYCNISFVWRYIFHVTVCYKQLIFGINPSWFSILLIKSLLWRFTSVSIITPLSFSVFYSTQNKLSRPSKKISTSFTMSSSNLAIADTTWSLYTWKEYSSVIPRSYSIEIYSCSKQRLGA
jgi:hypothetical protein